MREVSILQAQLSVRDILRHLGEDVNREGLRETSMRNIKFLKQFMEKPEFKMTAFDSEGYDEMIIEKNITFYSLCEHHMVPFFGIGAIAYIPDKKILGLSKLARVLDYYAHGLQNQERITKQVAMHIQKILKPKGVAVMLNARHLCIEMRGVNKPGVETTTSYLTGVFKKEPSCKNEFLNLIK